MVASKARPQWVVWLYASRPNAPGRQKWTNVSFNARTIDHADSTASGTNGGGSPPPPERPPSPPVLPVLPVLPVVLAPTRMKIAVHRPLTARRCRWPPGCDDWTVTPNLWGGIVGPPGALKTPAVDQAAKPLRRLQAAAIARHEEAMAAYQVEAEIVKAMAKAAREEMAKAARDHQDPARLRELVEQTQRRTQTAPPTLKRYLVNDATVEALGERLKENPNGLMLERDELTAFLRALDKPGHETDRAFYLEAWAGHVTNFTYDRIGRGTIIIPAVCLSIFGTVQPGPISHYLREASGGRGADGLIQRFQVLFYPDAPAWDPVDRWPDIQARNRAYALYDALDSLDPRQAGAQEDEGTFFLRFAPEAQALFNEWWTDLERTRLRSGHESPTLESHLSKYRSLMPSLALLFHLVEVVDGAAPGPVTLHAARTAAAWCDLLEAHARRLFQAAYDHSTEAAVRLGQRLGRLIGDPLTDSFTAREVARKEWEGLNTVADAQHALNILEAARWVQEVDVRSGPQGGRPSRVYWVNPEVELQP